MPVLLYFYLSHILIVSKCVHKNPLLMSLPFVLDKSRIHFNVRRLIHVGENIHERQLNKSPLKVFKHWNQVRHVKNSLNKPQPDRVTKLLYGPYKLWLRIHYLKKARSVNQNPEPLVEPCPQLWFRTVDSATCKLNKIGLACLIHFL